MKVLNQEQGRGIKISIQPEAELQTEEERRKFYKNFNQSDKHQRIRHVHRNVSTI